MTTASLPLVSIIVLNWNGASDTVNCVRSLLALDYPSFEVVVCDNDSRPDSWHQLLTLQTLAPGSFACYASQPESLQAPSAGAKIVLIQTGANLGFAGGVNVGLRYALRNGQAQYFWVLNNDTEVDSSALSALVARMQARPGIGICGSSLVLHADRSRMQAFGGARYQPARANSMAIGHHASFDAIPQHPDEIEREMDYVIGASMLVSRRFVTEVGLMDESYFLYSEEHDWAERGKGRFALGYAPDSLVYHRHGATIGTDASGGSSLSIFYLFRNKLAFTRRHHPQLYWSAAISLGWTALKWLIKGDVRKCRAALRGMLAEPQMKPFTS